MTAAAAAYLPVADALLPRRQHVEVLRRPLLLVHLPCHAPHGGVRLGERRVVAVVVRGVLQQIANLWWCENDFCCHAGVCGARERRPPLCCLLVKALPFCTTFDFAGGNFEVFCFITQLRGPFQQRAKYAKIKTCENAIVQKVQQLLAPRELLEPFKSS